jgi:hypothetical protein
LYFVSISIRVFNRFTAFYREAALPRVFAASSVTCQAAIPSTSQASARSVPGISAHVHKQRGASGVAANDSSVSRLAAFLGRALLDSQLCFIFKVIFEYLWTFPKEVRRSLQTGWKYFDCKKLSSALNQVMPRFASTGIKDGMLNLESNQLPSGSCLALLKSFLPPLASSLPALRQPSLLPHPPSSAIDFGKPPARVPGWARTLARRGGSWGVLFFGSPRPGWLSQVLLEMAGNHSHAQFQIEVGLLQPERFREF